MAFGLLVSALCDNEQVYNKYLHVHSHIYFLSGRDPVVPRQLLSKSPVVWDYLASGGDARLSQVRVFRAISTDKRKLIYT